uniref:Uncharacterized protein n=1 Tax=Ananas comosus var. bracteatus TaxID=296719 RepID=A0A6V7NF27_ANACO|nr:unnamed protein product [Ananas comosus var. bracteatus]
MVAAAVVPELNSCGAWLAPPSPPPLLAAIYGEHLTPPSPAPTSGPRAPSRAAGSRPEQACSGQAQNRAFLGPVDYRVQLGDRCDTSTGGYFFDPKSVQCDLAGRLDSVDSGSRQHIDSLVMCFDLVDRDSALYALVSGFDPWCLAVGACRQLWRVSGQVRVALASNRRKTDSVRREGSIQRRNLQNSRFSCLLYRYKIMLYGTTSAGNACCTVQGYSVPVQATRTDSAALGLAPVPVQEPVYRYKGVLVESPVGDFVADVAPRAVRARLLPELCEEAGRGSVFTVLDVALRFDAVEVGDSASFLDFGQERRIATRLGSLDSGLREESTKPSLARFGEGYLGRIPSPVDPAEVVLVRGFVRCLDLAFESHRFSAAAPPADQDRGKGVASKSPTRLTELETPYFRTCGSVTTYKYRGTGEHQLQTEHNIINSPIEQTSMDAHNIPNSSSAASCYERKRTRGKTIGLKWAKKRKEEKAKPALRYLKT